MIIIFSINNPPKLGEVVLIDANVITVKKNLVNTEATFTNSSGQPLAKGTHTIYVVSGGDMKVDFK